METVAGHGGGRPRLRHAGAARAHGPERTHGALADVAPDFRALSPVSQVDLVHARARRRLQRGIKKKGTALLKKLRKKKKECGPYDKPDVVKTHLRDMLIMPEMIGSVVGVHNGKVFTSVEVKADMVGHYLGEFSISYKPVRHGRPGIGATSSSKFIPLK